MEAILGLLGKAGGLLSGALGGPVVAVVGGVAILAGLAVAKKQLPKLISKIVGDKLDDLLDMEKPEDRALVLALVKWAEVKIPDKKMGRKKWALVASKLTSLFPFLKNHQAKITEIIELGFNAMDQELKEASGG